MERTDEEMAKLVVECFKWFTEKGRTAAVLTKEALFREGDINEIMAEGMEWFEDIEYGKEL